MSTWTLMTAMPPTKGHQNLGEFVSNLGPGRGNIIVCTQPDEPFARERYYAVLNGCPGATVHWLHRELPQDPNSEGFWLMWYKIMKDYGFKPGDTFVSSEPYGAKLAEVCDGIFMPYDIGRELLPTRATDIRSNPIKKFADIMPTFQNTLRTKVTFWGAESTGKTTLSLEVSKLMNGHWLYEYARPYLEAVGPEITIDAMLDIWRGQLSAERHAEKWYDKPYLFQDTDLFSTIGYWMQPHWQDALGPVPDKLIKDALERKSDLYVIPLSNIPFEQDTIRYGVDKRESPDEFWLGIADRFKLNYVTLDTGDFHKRVSESMWQTRLASEAKVAGMKYERQFNASETVKR